MTTWQTFTESLGGLPPACALAPHQNARSPALTPHPPRSYVPSFQMPDAKSAVKFECSVAENLGHLLSMCVTTAVPSHSLSHLRALLSPCGFTSHLGSRDARVVDPSNLHRLAEVLAPYSQGKDCKACVIHFYGPCSVHVLLP